MKRQSKTTAGIGIPNRWRRESGGVATIALAILLFAPEAPAAPLAFHSAVEADGPVLWYKFHEAVGPAANSGSLGEAFDGQILGTPLRASPTESGDKAIRFVGADDYVESGAVAPGNLTGNPTFTAEAIFFVVPDGTASLWAPFLHWGSSPAGPTMKSVYFSFQRHDAERVFAGFYNGGLRTQAIAGRGKWHHVIWVREGGGAANVGSTVYLDGEAVALEDDPQLPSDDGTPAVDATEFRVNRARDFTRFFTGSIDELVLYDKALTPEQAAAHYEAAVSVPCPEDRCIDYDGGCKGCGRPTGDAGKPNATDALFVLRRAVGARGCNLCVCDVDNGGSVVASDALTTLRRAVGQPIELVCPDPVP